MKQSTLNKFFTLKDPKEPHHGPVEKKKPDPVPAEPTEQEPVVVKDIKMGAAIEPLVTEDAKESDVVMQIDDEGDEEGQTESILSA
ncbi:hypothetical protein BC938DRAFT_476127 [Jimgerdemannia flammicorona]|uniref:Uncharacterized protein n=1 Tax=Jimgerdemannia flammicorona TaxID=994334 RepID=A0A433QQY4_9FUNG|nr:hypothetical protein BC938DRAFT_476127 [Jimgerdemannia flammicorona]